MVTKNKKQIDTKVLNNVFYVVTMTTMKSLCTRTTLRATASLFPREGVSTRVKLITTQN